MDRFANSSTRKISDFLKTKQEGTTFVHDDFKELCAYSCVRSALVRLCKSNELIRICQGVYMKPGAPMPDNIHIAKEIVRRSETKAVLKANENIGNTNILTFVTDGASRNITLADGTVVKFIHVNYL